MAKGKHATPMTRSERIERASELFGRGWTDADVMRELKVARNTVRSYRVIYEERLQKTLVENPRFLQDVAGNTMRMLQEYEEVRRTAWMEHHKAGKSIKVECPRCERSFKIPSPDYDTRNKLLKTVLAAQEGRAKLFGTLGVKQEFLAMVANVERVQQALIKFMTEELCDHDREKLLAYLSTPEIAQYMNASAPFVSADSWEEDGPAELAQPA